MLGTSTTKEDKAVIEHNVASIIKTVLKMSSTQQLAVGYSSSLSTLKARWLSFNNAAGHHVWVSQNIAKPKARYFSVCCTAPKTGWNEDNGHCLAHIKAIGPTRDEMTVSSIDLNHTCQGTKGSHKRNSYRTSDISEVSNVLNIYYPITRKEGNTKQFMRMAKAATGFTIKKDQATNTVRSRCIGAQVGQHFWLPT